MTEKSLLVGDIGGTNARFALANPDADGYRHERVLLCADYETPELAIADYLNTVEAPAPSIICLAAAGPIINSGVDLTNNNWHIGESTLHANFEISHARLLNDFEAIAYGLTILDVSDMQVVGLHSAHSLATEDFCVGVIGPGTGFGAAVLASRNNCIFPLKTEAGHVGFAPENAI